MNYAVKIKQTFFLLILCMCDLTFADSAVWKISGEKSYLYLAGTMHVLSKEDYPLPGEFDQAYADATHIVFETDIGGMSDPAVVQAMLKELSYSDGSSLFDRLSPQTTQLLKEYCDNKGIPLSALQLFKPGMLLGFLTVTELNALGIDAPGVEDYYDGIADVDGKTEGQLESVEAQIAFLARIGEENPDEFVRYMVEDLSQMGMAMDELRRSWRTGDLDAIDQMMNEALKEFPDTYKLLLTDRNNNWLPQIEAMVTSSPTELVLVGTAHLAGSDGLLELLSKNGYQIERL